MKNGKYIIGIAGGSASGKSTFTEKLEEELRPLETKVFHMDSYFKTPEHRPKAISPINGKSYIDDNHPLTMDLPALGNDIEEYISNGTAKVIIIEGLLTLWDEKIFNNLDLKLFIDCRADERIVRRIKRNMEWGQTFEQISEVYLDLVRFRHDEYVEPSRWKADLIINGSQKPSIAVEMITSWIKNKIK